MATWKAAGEAGRAAVKLTTNMTGLDVAKNPHHLLGVFYNKTLRACAKMPSDYPYRKYTEQVRSTRRKRGCILFTSCIKLGFPFSPLILIFRSSRSEPTW